MVWCKVRIYVADIFNNNRTFFKEIFEVCICHTFGYYAYFMRENQCRWIDFIRSKFIVYFDWGKKLILIVKLLIYVNRWYEKISRKKIANKKRQKVYKQQPFKKTAGIKKKQCESREFHSTYISRSEVSASRWLMNLLTFSNLKKKKIFSNFSQKKG